MDFKNYQSPTLVIGEGDAVPLSSFPHTRDVESSVVGTRLGQDLYNAEIYGSLRNGGAVKFFSHYCLGLVAATFSSTFATECLTNMIQPMLAMNFGLSPAELAASQRLTSLPTLLSFFFGMLSDCYPILGLRRKGYMLLGLATTVVSFFLIAALTSYAQRAQSSSPNATLIALIIAFAALAMTGNVLMYVSVHTRVAELSQREPLGLRGSIQATYLVFRCIVYIVADACLYAVNASGDATSTPYSTALIVFGFVIALPVPLIIKHWEEKCYSLSTPMKTRGQILWKVLQQKAVWTVVIFQCFFTLFLFIKFSGPSAVVSVWAGASTDNVFVQQFMYYFTTILTVLAWRYYFMNRPWRQFYAACPILLIIPQLIVAGLVTMDILRDRYFFHFMSIFTSISAAIGWIGSVVPLTEIIQEGSEGAMVGLMLSLYFLVNMFVQTNSVGLFEGSNFYDPAEVAADTPQARMDVFTALLLNYGINAVGFVGLYFLPRQKLDTQQLRSYGGYTKCASAAVVTFSAAMFLYSLTITVMTFIPATSCIRIAGGTGC